MWHSEVAFYEIYTYLYSFTFMCNFFSTLWFFLSEKIFKKKKKKKEYFYVDMPESSNFLVIERVWLEKNVLWVLRQITYNSSFHNNEHAAGRKMRE